MPEQPCPTIDELTDYSLGRSDQQRREEVGDHVEICSACQAQLHTVSDAGDTFVATLRREVTGPAYEDESDCQNVLQRVAAIGRDPSFTTTGRQHDRSQVGHPQTIRDYELFEKLGEGGMGAVYKALHTQLEKVVALKILPATRMKDESAVARFKREMKAVGKLDHPNIVGAMDAGEDQGVHFLVMQYVDGLDLSTLTRRVGPLTVADACDLIRQAADGLQHAHEHGMVHRDVKPSNLMLASQGRVKILDLGLALLSENGRQPGAELTSTGQMMGTLDYMAPEQGSSSHEVDIRADVYALGATLYRLLTGQAPFADEQYNTPVKKLTALATEDVPSLGTKRDDLPAELVTIVDKMLAKNPDDRFATPQEVADALAPVAEGADLEVLLQTAATQDTASTEDPLAVATHESLKSGSVETDPTIDMHGSQPGQSTGVGTAQHNQPDRASNRLQKPSPSGRRLIGKRQLAIAAAVVGVILLAAVILYFKTGSGTIVVEMEDPTIQVSIEGEKLKITRDQSGEAYRIKPGEKVLHITRGELRFDTDKFELSRGEKVVLTVRLVDGQVQVQRGPGQDARVIGRSTLPPEATAIAPGTSPMDSLDPANIPPAQRAVWEADGVEIPGAELVAVLGEHRGGHDRPGIIWFHRPNAVGFTPDGKLAVTASADAVRIWDVEGMQLRGEIPRFGGAHCLRTAVSPVEDLLAVGMWRPAELSKEKQRLRLYKLRDGRPEFDRAFSSDHEGEMGFEHLAFSPDGRRLLSGGTRSYKKPDGETEDKGDLCLWDVQTGKEIQRFDEHENGEKVVDVAWSPDGQRFATAASQDPSIRIWDAEKLVVVRRLELDRPFHNSWLTFSADGKRIYANTLGKSYVWSVEDGRELPRMAAFGQVAMFKDGKRAAYANNRSVGVVDLDTRVARLRLPTRAVTHADIPLFPLALSADDKRILTTDGDKGVHLWDADSGKELYPRTGHVARIECLEFSPDGQLLASGGFDGTIRLWGIRDGVAKERAILRGSFQFFRTVTFSPNGKTLVATDRGGSVYSWDVATSPPMQRGVVDKNSGQWHDAWLNAQGNRLIYYGASAEIRWIDTSGSLESQILSTLTDQITRTPDGKRTVCVSSTGKVQLWDTSGADAKLLRDWSDFKLAKSVVLHPGGEILAEPRVQELQIGEPQVVMHLWDIRGKEPKLAAKLAPQPARKWSGLDLARNGGEQSFVPHFSPDGRTLWLLDAEGRAYAWDVASKKLIHRWKIPTHSINIAISPNGRHIAIGSRLGAISILRLR